MEFSGIDEKRMRTVDEVRLWYRRLIIALCVFPILGGVAVGIAGDGIVPDLHSIPLAAGAVVGVPLLGFLIIGFVAIPRSRRRLLLPRTDYDEQSVCREMDPGADFPDPLIFDLATGLAKVYKVPVGKLRAADRFKEDLSLAPNLLFDYAGDDRFDWATSYMCNVSPPIPLATIPTVGEFIQAIARAITSEQAEV